MNTQRTSVFLMANLGSEVSRILSAKDRNNNLQVRESLERALNILKEIMTISDMKTRIVEMNTLSDLINEMAKPKPIFHVSRKNISSYFIPFVLKAMNVKV